MKKKYARAIAPMLREKGDGDCKANLKCAGCKTDDDNAKISTRLERQTANSIAFLENKIHYDFTLASVLADLYELVGKPVVERLGQLHVPKKSPQPKTLPGARGEIDVVQVVGSSVTTLVSEFGKGDTHYRGSGPHHRFVHFVCHGLLETGKPFDASFELHGDPPADRPIPTSCRVGSRPKTEMATKGCTLRLRFDSAAVRERHRTTELRTRRSATLREICEGASVCGEEDLRWRGTLERWVNFCSLQLMIARRRFGCITIWVTQCTDVDQWIRQAERIFGKKCGGGQCKSNRKREGSGLDHEPTEATERGLREKAYVTHRSIRSKGGVFLENSRRGKGVIRSGKGERDEMQGEWNGMGTEREDGRSPSGVRRVNKKIDDDDGSYKSADMKRTRLGCGVMHVVPEIAASEVARHIAPHWQRLIVDQFPTDFAVHLQYSDSHDISPNLSPNNLRVLRLYLNIRPRSRVNLGPRYMSSSASAPSPTIYGVWPRQWKDWASSIPKRIRDMTRAGLSISRRRAVRGSTLGLQIGDGDHVWSRSRTRRIRDRARNFALPRVVDVPMRLSWATMDAYELTGRVESRLRGGEETMREREGGEEKPRPPNNRGMERNDWR
ncbi:hypothetical protein EDB86DRAFT_2831338 [Lactarius hatsudake]|nr:hypothetical protein EDB86DRAFT_2831338 [Lactarius hatsudake]